MATTIIRSAETATSAMGEAESAGGDGWKYEASVCDDYVCITKSTKCYMDCFTIPLVDLDLVIELTKIVRIRHKATLEALAKCG